MSDQVTLSAASTFGDGKIGAGSQLTFSRDGDSHIWTDQTDSGEDPARFSYCYDATTAEIEIQSNLSLADTDLAVHEIARQLRDKAPGPGYKDKDQPILFRVVAASDAMKAELQWDQMEKEVVEKYKTHPKTEWVLESSKYAEWTRLIHPEKTRFDQALIERTPSLFFSARRPPGFDHKVEKLVQAMYAAGWAGVRKSTEQRLKLYDAIKDLPIKDLRVDL